MRRQLICCLAAVAVLASSCSVNTADLDIQLAAQHTSGGVSVAPEPTRSADLAQPTPTAAPSDLPKTPIEAMEADSQPEAMEVDLAAAGLNQGAVFDQFVLDLFPGARPSDYGPIQILIGGRCLGLLDENSIRQTTVDPQYHGAVIAIDESDCTSSFVSTILVRADPTGAASFSEALAIRWSRVLTWHTENEFILHALELCLDRPISLLQYRPAVVWSSSVQIELDGLLRENECDLPGGIEREPASPSLSEPASTEAETTETGMGTDFTIYYSVSEGIGTDHFRSHLYSLHVATGTVHQITTEADAARGGYGIPSLSPDGRRMALLIENPNSNSTYRLHILDLDTGVRNDLGIDVPWVGSNWSDDGSLLYLRGTSARGDVAVTVVNIESKTHEPLVETAGVAGNVFFVGVWSDRVIFQRGYDEKALFIADATTGEIVEQFEIGNGYASLDSGSDQALVYQPARDPSPGEDPGTLAVIDLGADELAMRAIPTADGWERNPQLSPDGSKLVVGFGTTMHVADFVRVIDVDDPTSTIDLIPPSAGQSANWMWSPDGSHIVFAHGSPYGWTTYLGTPDGDIVDLGVDGKPVAVRMGE